MNSCKNAVSQIAVWFALAVPLVPYAQLLAETPDSTNHAPLTTGHLTQVAANNIELSDVVRSFQQHAREFMARHYDFHLGLCSESPQHSVLRALVMELKATLQSTPDSPSKAFVLTRLAATQGLEKDGELRRSVNELMFCMTRLCQFENQAAGSLPVQDVLVEEPWRRIKSEELVLNCDAQRLIAALQSDSQPDTTKQGLEAYRRLADASTLIMEETLDDNEGGTKAALLEIEEAGEWNELERTVVKHPVLIFRITKTFLDKFDWDENGQPESKTIEFRMRQRVQTMRDEQGRLTEHLVTNEMLDPVLVGGTPSRGQFGLQYYKTVLSVRAVPGKDETTRVAFRILSIPDFRGRLAKSRIRQAVSIFMHLENRRLASRTLDRIAEHWPPRATASDLVVSSD